MSQPEFSVAFKASPVRHDDGSPAKPQWTWYPLDAVGTALIRALFANQCHRLEAAWQCGGPDHRVIADVRWDGERRSRIRTATDPAEPDRDGLLDQRAWVLNRLSVEGRGAKCCCARGAASTSSGQRTYRS